MKVDTYRHKGMRKKMVDVLRKKGISDEKVLAAFETVPRHFLLDDSFVERAYDDQPFQIGFGQTISQPYTVARQTELLEVQKGDKILEIGTGSGYQAMILAELGARVFSIERFKALHLKAKQSLAEMGYKRIKLFFGDGFEGLPHFAPFDKIIITAAAPEIPKKLVEQLKVGGKMVIPLGEGDVQQMTCLTKLTEEGEFKINEEESYRFVPMLKGKVR